MPPRSLLRDVLSRRMLACLLLGFSSGLPLYVILQLVPAWLRTAGVSLKDIGLLSLVNLPYAWKFLWAPLVDRYALPLLGRRRGWALLTQLALCALIAGLGYLDPARSTLQVALLALGVACFGATQDIALDAYRRDLLADHELGLGNAVWVNAYRSAALVPGALALVLADHVPWPVVHGVVASFMVVGMLAAVLAPEPPPQPSTPKTLLEAVVEPLRELLARGDLRWLLRLLAFLLLYKLGDGLATALVTPFYLDLGFSLTEIGSVAKLVGFWSTLGGSILGGLLMLRIGINRALWLFGGVQMVAILGFLALALVGRSLPWLAGVVFCEYLGVGLGTAAFSAFIARATDRRFSATQFALFSSFVALPRTFANASAGYLIESLGYPAFFALCTVLALPGMALLASVAPWNESSTATPAP